MLGQADGRRIDFDRVEHGCQAQQRLGTGIDVDALDLQLRQPGVFLFRGGRGWGRGSSRSHGWCGRRALDHQIAYRGFERPGRELHLAHMHLPAQLGAKLLFQLAFGHDGNNGPQQQPEQDNEQNGAE